MPFKCMCINVPVYVHTGQNKGAACTTDAFPGGIVVPFMFHSCDLKLIPAGCRLTSRDINQIQNFWNQGEVSTAVFIVVFD